MFLQRHLRGEAIKLRGTQNKTIVESKGKYDELERVGERFVGKVIQLACNLLHSLSLKIFLIF